MVVKKTRNIYGSRLNNKRTTSRKRKNQKPIFNITPKQLYFNLAKSVFGQYEALEKLSNSICYHYRRLSYNNIGDKSNVLLIGPTGCGKTYLIKKVTEALDIPLAVIDATKFSGTGYVGLNVESMIDELFYNSGNNIEKTSRGLIYIDEIDKIACCESFDRDVSGRDVQNGLLKIIEDGEVEVRHNNRKHKINTKNILFVCGGAFSDLYSSLEKENYNPQYLRGNELLFKLSNKELTDALINYGMIPELLGRIPVIARLRELGPKDIFNILKDSNESPINSYIEDFKSYGITAKFRLDSYDKIAQLAYERGNGARGIKSVLEETLIHYKFYLPGTGIKNIEFTAKMFDEPTDGFLEVFNNTKNITN